MTDLPSWDEADRPRAQNPPTATDGDRAHGDHLRMIHDMFRQGLAQVGAVVAQVVAGEAGVGAARAAVHAVGLRATYEQLGSFCGQLCRGIEMHHRIEDADLYPALRAADDDLGAVLDRLYDEHEVVHELLVRLDATLVELTDQPDLIGDLERQFVHLRRLLESHFAYEEEQIGLPLGVHRILI